MHKQDLALNNQKELICHKTQPTNNVIFSCYKIHCIAFNVCINQINKHVII